MVSHVHSFIHPVTTLCSIILHLLQYIHPYKVIQISSIHPKNRHRARSAGTEGNRATEGKSNRPTEGNEGATEIESEGTSERERERERERAKEGSRDRERERAKERASAGPENHGQKETPGMSPGMSSSSTALIALSGS
jgi:hypothetical protein